MAKSHTALSVKTQFQNGANLLTYYINNYFVQNTI